MTAAWRHNAPAVRVPVGATRRLAAGLWLAWGAGCGAALLFVLASAPSWRTVLIFLGLSLGAWNVRHALRSVPRGTLSWSGLQWQWLDERAGAASALPGSGPDSWPVVIEPLWDAGAAVLLRCRDDRVTAGRWFARTRSLWLWVERPVVLPPGGWRAFRRAVYSPARH